tara:strand:- start:109173 stop:109664 length:492 start_codon:yes stop_codon:yes gene_type:complete
LQPPGNRRLFCFNLKWLLLAEIIYKKSINGFLQLKGVGMSFLKIIFASAILLISSAGAFAQNGQAQKVPTEIRNLCFVYAHTRGPVHGSRLTLLMTTEAFRVQENGKQKTYSFGGELIGEERGRSIRTYVNIDCTFKEYDEKNMVFSELLVHPMPFPKELFSQ